MNFLRFFKHIFKEDPMFRALVKICSVMISFAIGMGAFEYNMTSSWCGDHYPQEIKECIWMPKRYPRK